MSCKPLPSSTSACALVQGEPGAGVLVLGHLLARAVIIAAGLALAGERSVVRTSLIAAAAIEAAALAWASSTRDQP